MAGFKIELFKGMRPRISSLKLNIGESVNAENCDLGTGDAEPFDDKSTEQAASATRQPVTIYKFDNAGAPVWFEWDDYVDVVRGPVKDDSLERTYYTGDTHGTGGAKMTNTDLVGSTGPYPEDWVYMGVPAPTTALTIVAPGLAEDVPSADRQIGEGTIKSKSMSVGTIEYTVYPGTGTEDNQWDLAAGALGSIGFDISAGNSFKVTSVINSNKVKLESLSESGIFAKTVNIDKTTVNDWQPFDNNGSTRVADFMGWSLPTGTTVGIVGHNLIVGDVITVSSVTNVVQYSQAIGGSVFENPFAGNAWDAEAVEYEDGVAVYRTHNARIWANGTYQNDHFISGSFYYDVDRTASTSSELEDRQYVYTYVTDLGEEGPPSPVSAVYEVLDGQTVAVGDLAVPPTVGYSITKMRIYRTNSTEAGTEYQFVKELDVATDTTDAVGSADLGEVIGTTTWDPPPLGLSGLTEMPNGMLVGFEGKNLYFCEPYFPHAWPAEYDQAIGHEIVGLASFGNSLAVMTKGHPYVVGGSHPRNMNIRPIKFNQACVSKESIATDRDRVYYASPDGLVEISVNGVRLATEAFLRKEDWATYSPSAMRSSFHEGRYYGFYDFDISAIPAVVSAEVSGTISTALESDIVNGARTIIITLINDLWVAAGTSFNNQRQNIIDGITASTSQTLGWNNILRDSDLVVGNVVRTSDTVATITLPTSSGYSVSSDEVVQVTIPAAALQNSNAAILTGSTFTITSESPAAQVTIGGTADTATEANIVTGGKTITLALTNDTWVAAGTDFDAERQGIIDGISATTNEADGYNDVVPQEIAVTDVVRTSDALVTVTLPAIALYDITTDESISAVVPATALVTSLTDASSLNSIAILASGAVSALFTGTATASVTENELVAGGKTIIITLTGDTWIATGTGPIGTTAESQALLDAIIATTTQTLGWNNVIVPGIDVATDLVRTSSTVATITLDPESTYSIATSESIGLDIPEAVLTTQSGSDLTVSNTFGVTAQAPVTAALTGTAAATIAENNIIDGGKTIIITLTSDTWAAVGTGPIGSTADTQAIIDGIDSAQSEAAGWDAEVKANLVPATDVVRTSDTVCTITLSAQASYAITAQETITATVPAAALVTSASPVVASPTFTVDVDVPATVVLSGTITAANANTIRDTGATIILTLADDTWVDAGATFDATRQDIIDGIDSGGAEAGGWDAKVKAVIGVSTVVRTSNTVVTITIPATADYIVTASETVTATVPAAAIAVSTIAVVAAPTFALDETLSTKVMVAIAARKISTTREAYFALAEDSFTAWTEDAVDSDTAGIKSGGIDVVYAGNDSRWVIMSGIFDTNYGISIHTSDDDGGSWTSRQDFNDSTPAFTGFSRTLYWDEDNDVLVGSASAYANLMYSTDGGVNWSESATPFGSLSATGGYSSGQFLYGGGTYLYSTGFSLYDAVEGAYDYYVVRSPDLTTPANVSNAWTEFEVTFDGSIGDSQSPNIASANGKIIVALADYNTATDYDIYISTVAHGGTTEVYVGKITAAYAGGYINSAASATKICFMNGAGYLLTCDAGNEGTIGNWTGPTTSSDHRITTDSIDWESITYDVGDAGKDGLGFVAVGQLNSTDDTVIYTSDDGVTWVLSETLTLADADPRGVAPNNLPVLD